MDWYYCFWLPKNKYQEKETKWTYPWSDSTIPLHWRPRNILRLLTKRVRMMGDGGRWWTGRHRWARYDDRTNGIFQVYSFSLSLSRSLLVFILLPDYWWWLRVVNLWLLLRYFHVSHFLSLTTDPSPHPPYSPSVSHHHNLNFNSIV